jgi:hypothetical protein
LTLGLVTVAMSVSLPALAQSNPNCPPGAWFCEDADVPPPPEAPTQAPAAPPPAEAAPTPPPPPARARRGGVHIEAHAGASVRIGSDPRPAPPPVVVYQPLPSAPPPQVVIVRPTHRVLVREVPPPPPRRAMRPTRWGLNLRVEGITLGHQRGAAENSGMGGMGLSFRYRPVPAFAIDAGVDLMGGRDYNGFVRTEVPLSLSGLLYVNPRSRVQFYFTGGFDWSHAKVHSDYASPLLTTEFGSSGYSAEYDYFGGHGGIGLEFRLARHVALNIDALGFVRGRTDDGVVPEFYDARTGRTTNTSGGGIFRGGITFWW